MRIDPAFFSTYGIDAIGFYSPKYALNLADLAEKRKINVEKYQYGLLQKEMRIADIGEDIINLSIKAALNLFIRNNIDPHGIDALFVATETPIYAVKAVSNILASILDISRNSITQDINNACAASTIAIVNAMSMLECGIIKNALVIGADISSYDFNSSAEPTQGAGAIALLLCAKPRIAYLSKNFGRVSSNINDFFRHEGEKNAQVFGKYSVNAYLELQNAAYYDLRDRLGLFLADYYIFHGPYARLPLKCMQQLITMDWIPQLDKISNYYLKNSPFGRISLRLDPTIQDTPIITNEMGNHIQSRFGFTQKTADLLSWLDNFLRRRILPPLHVPMSFGNMYNVAIWAQFAYLMENILTASDIIYFGAYGSGATCISGLLKMSPTFKQRTVPTAGVSEYRIYKTKCSYNEYETHRLNPQLPDWYWAKVEPVFEESNVIFHLNYCDQGCLLSPMVGMDHCPEGHAGNHSLIFPLHAKVVSNLIPITNWDFTNILKGMNIISGCIQINELIELDLKRAILGNPKTSKNGLIHWIPVYTACENSPLFNFINKKLKGEIKIAENIGTKESVPKMVN